MENKEGLIHLSTRFRVVQDTVTAREWPADLVIQPPNALLKPTRDRKWETCMTSQPWTPPHWGHSFAQQIDWASHNAMGRMIDQYKCNHHFGDNLIFSVVWFGVVQTLLRQSSFGSLGQETQKIIYDIIMILCNIIQYIYDVIYYMLI